MNTTDFRFSTSGEAALVQSAPRFASSRPAPALEVSPRVGIIRNAKARHNMARSVEYLHGPGCAMPESKAELHHAIAGFAARGVEVLVIDGGDGTIRDVLCAALDKFTNFPAIAVIPSGKTNALANDLGVPAQWTIQSALDAVRQGRIVERAPIEIRYPNSSAAPLLGFIWGTGAFSRATALAQTTHKLGAFNGVAVGLSIVGGVAQTLFGGSDNAWRRGDQIRVVNADGSIEDRNAYLMLASTLSSLPAGVMPFGKTLNGMKLLDISAPPRRLSIRVPELLAGSERRALADDGYRRSSIEEMRLMLDTDFILDGESFPGGDILLRRGDPIRFVVP